MRDLPISERPVKLKVNRGKRIMMPHLWAAQGQLSIVHTISQFFSFFRAAVNIRAVVSIAALFHAH